MRPRQQARRLLAAESDIADEHPRLCRLAATLADGRPVGAAAIALLDRAAEPSRAEIQKSILGDYHARRDAAVERKWTDLGWRDRRRATREHFAAEYDDTHLCICDTCTLVYQRPVDWVEAPRNCDYCGGALLDWNDRAAPRTLAQRANAIRVRLTIRAANLTGPRL